MKGHASIEQQKNLHRHHLGFTIIEVSIYLAITAMLFAGIAITTQSRIERQRYNESVNDFAEFLRNVYSEVENTQNVNYGSTNPTYRKGCTVDSAPTLMTIIPTGQSNCAFYGKVIIFEEDNDANKITVADLIGETIEHGESLETKFSSLSSEVKEHYNNSNTIFGSLLAVRAGFRANICTSSDESSDCEEDFAAAHYEYNLPYDYRIENRIDKPETTKSGLYANNLIIIARTPYDNQIHTLWYGGETKRSSIKIDDSSYVKFSQFYTDHSDLDNMPGGEPRYPTRNTHDFCIDQSSDPETNSINRRNVRILPETKQLKKENENVIYGEDTGTGVSSPSSVVIIAQDSNRNTTDENNGYYGNRCKW